MCIRDSFPASNLRQALLPAGAESLPNRAGTAPGFLLPVGDALLAALPGPPREMVPMLEGELLPRLRERGAADLATERADFYLFGLPESAFADQVGAWMERGANPLLNVTASRFVLRARLLARGATAGEARALLEARAAELRALLGEWIFSTDEPALERVVGRHLIERGRSVAVAESCTGGLVASLLTRVPGISSVFHAGWVTYSNAAKTRELGVPADLIERCGAVSEEVARAMAEGAAVRAGAPLAVSVTGVAGPEGGTAEKPVGLVWFGLRDGDRTTATERRFPAAGREAIRQWAARTALSLLDRAGND